VVGRPRLRLIFNLLRVGRVALLDAVVPPLKGANVVVEIEVLPPEGVRNLPRLFENFSVFAKLEISFCTVSSSIGL